jgi:hypothetical protein
MTPSSLGNPELGPERGEEIEAGFDASFFERARGPRVHLLPHAHEGRHPAPAHRAVDGLSGIALGERGTDPQHGCRERSSAPTWSRHQDFGWDMNLSDRHQQRARWRSWPAATRPSSREALQYRIGYAPNSFFVERVVSADFDATTGRRDQRHVRRRGRWYPPPASTRRARWSRPGSTWGARRRRSRARWGRPSVSSSRSDPQRASWTSSRGYRKTDNNLRARCQVFRTCLENMQPEDYDPKVIAQMQTSGTLRDFVINDASFTRLREVVAHLHGLPESLARPDGRPFARASTWRVAT